MTTTTNMKTTTPNPTAKLDQFTRGYIGCALWSTMDNSGDSGGDPLDRNYSLNDIAGETIANMVKDCKQFQLDNAADLALVNIGARRAGFLFWLNRNGHGSGFWDEYNGADTELRAAFVRLSNASKVWGSVDLYVGDDGKIYS